MAGIYFHIPFCKRLCGYCDFMRSVKMRYLPQVLEQMHAELGCQRDFLSDKTIKTIYFGGGTPSVVEPAELERFIEQIGELYDISAVEEITVEVNPDDISEQYVEALKRTRINRISMGIQSLDNQCLQFMGRRHSAEEAVEAVKILQRAGYNNISVDIIFGVYGFDVERTLQQIIELRVQHISAYHLTIEENTRFGRMLGKGEIEQVSEQRSEQEFAAVHNALVAAGFEHYEVSNYAKKGYRSRHNSSYWTGAEYLGIGPGAHSFAQGVRRWCEQSVEQYVEGVAYGSEQLSVQDAVNEYVMVGLRRAEGISTDYIAKMWGEQHRDRIVAAAEKFVNVGWVVKNSDRIAIPTDKFLISDTVIEAFFE